MKMYTHWAPLAHSFPYVSKTFSGPEIGAQVERSPGAVSRAIKETTPVISFYIKFCILYMLNILLWIYVYV